MVMSVDRDESQTLNAGNAVAFTVDFGGTAPAVPTDPTATPASGWVQVGACDQSGLTEGFKMTTQNVMALGVQTPFRVLYTEQEKTFKVTMLEFERDIVQSVMFRVTLASLARDGNGLRSTQENATLIPDRRPWLFRIADGNSIQQIYVPAGEVNQISDVVYDQKAVAMADTTMICYPDASGITAYRLDNFPAAA